MQNKIIISMLALVLSACGGSGSPAGNKPADAETTQTEANKETDPIALGLPVQSRMELSATTYNPRGWDVTGTQVEVTARLADKYGRPVTDGLRVNFTAEGGDIGEFCTTTNGACSVNWVSMDRRPGSGTDADNLFPNEQIGVVTITAHSEGEADFADQNQNGLFDAGESFVAYAEPFADYNNNGTREDGEWLLADTDGDGGYTSEVPTVFLGSSCSASARSAGHCPYNMHVRDSIRIVMSGNDLVMRVFEGNDINSYINNPATTLPDYKWEAGNVTVNNGFNGIDKDTQYYFVLQDQNGNMPATGTTLAVQIPTEYLLSGLTGDVDNAVINTVNGNVIYGMVYPLSVSEVSVATNPVITVTVTSEGDSLEVKLPIN